MAKAPGTIDLSPRAGGKLPEAGEMYSHFVLERCLGEGGMGVVWLASDPTLGRQAALKFLNVYEFFCKPRELEELKKRFVREARLLARIDHPGLVQVYEAHLDRGLPYFAMEYIDGTDLETRMEEIPALSYRHVCEIGLQVAEVLDHVWRHHGLVHRDLKPANVMLTSEGRAKLLDLGLAKVTVNETTNIRLNTHTGVAWGTLAYMSPEQHRGEPVDYRSDLYSLGVMLCQLLTFRLPFPGKGQLEIYEGKEKGLAFDLRRYAPGLPAVIAAALREMLEPDRERRLDSYGEVIGALRDALQSLPPSPRKAVEVEPSELSSMVTERLGVPERGRRGRHIVASSSLAEPLGVSVPQLARDRTGAGVAVDASGAAGRGAGSERGAEATTMVGADAHGGGLMAGLPPLRPGTPVGDYELLEWLGNGTCGRVWRARRQGTEAEVALKILNVELTDSPGFEHAFEAMMRRLRGLASTAALVPREWFRFGPCRVLVYELCVGPERRPMHLLRLCAAGDDGVLPQEVVRKLALQALGALEAAHSSGIVHGNLKPQNVLFHYLMPEQGVWRTRLKLADLGLADLLGQRDFASRVEQVTRSGVVQPVRTVHDAAYFDSQAYMAPEQLNGSAAVVESDLYSLGRVLFRCLTGHVDLKRCPRPSTAREGIATEWDPILRKVLRTDPDRRFHSALEMREYIEALPK